MTQTTSTDRRVEAFVADLEDLADHLSLRSFTIVALAGSGLAAIAYAADHAERVERMVLWNVYPSIPELRSDPRIASLTNLASTDWELFTERCSGKGFLFADRGEFVAKGFEEPVRV